MAKRISIIGSTTPTASWRDDEIQMIEKTFLKPGLIQGVNGAMAVSQRGAGANLSVDVAAGRALIQITNTNLSPSKTYNVYFDAETDTGTATNVAIAAADLTNPRIDIIVAKVDVSQNPDASAGNIGTIIVVTGTPAGSPSAPATPANCILLANVAVAAGAVSIVNANITDKRVYVTSNSATLLDIMRQGLANNVAVLSGTNTCTGAMNPPITSYIDGAVYFVIPVNDCSGAVTVDIGGGAKSVKKQGATALTAQDMKAKCMAMLQYNLADDNFKLISTPNGSPAGAVQTISDKTADYVVGTADSGNVLTTNGAVLPLKFTLPTPSAGLNFTFAAYGNSVVLNAATNSGQILLNNKSQTYLIFSRLRGTVKLIALDATYWAIASIAGKLAPFYGYVIGGHTGGNASFTSAEKLDFSNDTQSTVASAVLPGATALMSPGSNDILCFLMGGFNSSGTALGTSTKMYWKTESIATVAYTLTTARTQGAGGQSEAFAYILGGTNGVTRQTDIDRIDFMNDAGKKITSVLPAVRGEQYGVSSPLAVYSLGGYNSPTPTQQNTIYKMVSETEVVSTPVATLPSATGQGASSYSMTHGYTHGGNASGTAIYILQFSNDTTSTFGASLAASKAGHTGLSGIKGYSLGSAATTSIQDVNYLAVTSTTIAAVLSTARGGACGAQPIAA